MKRLPRSIRKYLRREKARIRREVFDSGKEKELIAELYAKVLPGKAAQIQGVRPEESQEKTSIEKTKKRETKQPQKSKKKKTLPAKKSKAKGGAAKTRGSRSKTKK